ncbi:MAG: hypothetical protein K2F87_01540 [Muribaculaceae bacterium]|nr:hypothetical protein [Muribaculaceae bacterium]
MILALSALTCNAEFTRLVFHTLDGNVQGVALSDLNITFSDGEMIATSGGESVRIDVASLEYMEFADNDTTVGVTGASSAPAGTVKVYTADGHAYGQFDSLNEACASLPGGLYLINTENGENSKIMINR